MNATTNVENQPLMILNEIIQKVVHLGDRMCNSGDSQREGEGNGESCDYQAEGRGFLCIAPISNPIPTKKIFSPKPFLLTYKFRFFVA